MFELYKLALNNFDFEIVRVYHMKTRNMQSLKTIFKKEIEPRKYYSQIKDRLHHILLAGALDALTTLIGLSVFSLVEINPLLNQLIPEHVYFVPFVLVELAFLRYIVVSTLFKKSKHFTAAIYFTLYFLPAWNTVNILYTQLA